MDEVGPLPRARLTCSGYRGHSRALEKAFSLLPEQELCPSPDRRLKPRQGREGLDGAFGFEKELTPALVPFCRHGGVCLLLPHQDSTGEERIKRWLCLKPSSYLSGLGRRFYVGDAITSGQVLCLPGLHCPGWQVTFIAHQHHGNIIRVFHPLDLLPARVRGAKMKGGRAAPGHPPPASS